MAGSDGIRRGTKAGGLLDVAEDSVAVSSVIGIIPGVGWTRICLGREGEGWGRPKRAGRRNNRGEMGGIGGSWDVVAIKIDEVKVSRVRVNSGRVLKRRFDRVDDVVVVLVGVVLDSPLQLDVADVLNRLVVAIAKESMANIEPNVNKEILSGLGEALAETGEIRPFNHMRACPLLCKGVSRDIAINVILLPSVVKKPCELFMISGVIKMSRHPLDAKRTIRSAAVKLAGWGVHEVVDNVFDEVPEVVVGVRSWGSEGVEDFAKVGDDGFVVAADQHRVNGVLHHLSNCPELSAISTVQIGV